MLLHKNFWKIIYMTCNSCFRQTHQTTNVMGIFRLSTFFTKNTQEPVLDFGLESGSAKGTYVWHLTLLFSSSHNLAYVPRLTFGFVKLLASSNSHSTKWADEQHRPAGFESRLVPNPLPFIPTLIGFRAFDLVSSRVWWETLANIGIFRLNCVRNRGQVLLPKCLF